MNSTNLGWTDSIRILPIALFAPAQFAMLAARPLSICVFVFVCATLLRFASLEAGLPQSRDPDSVIVTQARAMERIRTEGKGHISPLYPLLLAHAIDAWPGSTIPTAAPDAPLEEHLAKARWPDLLGRGLVALFSLLALPAVWLLARKWSSPFGATVAMAFVGTALVHVVYTRMARPHGPVSAFGVLSVLALSWSLQRPTWTRMLVACSLVGMCIGTLHSGAAVLSACLVASVWLLRREGLKMLPRLLAGLGLMALIVIYCYPFLLEGTPMFSTREFESPFNGDGLERILPRMLRADPVLLLCSGLGLLLLLASLRRVRPGLEKPGAARDTAWLCAAHVVPYVLAICAYRSTWLRFVLVALPYMALLAALPFERLHRRGSPRLAGVLAVLALALPTYASTRYVLIQGRPDTNTLAGEALMSRIHKRDRVVYSAFVSVPIPQAKGTINLLARSLRSPWHQYQSMVPIQWDTKPVPLYPLARKADHALRLADGDIEGILAERTPRYGLINMGHQRTARIDPTLTRVLAAGGRELASWMPYGSDARSPNDLADPEEFLLRYAFKLQNPGRPIGLFEFPRVPKSKRSK